MPKYIVEVLDHRSEWRDFDSKKLHRIDGPAVEYANGVKEYWVDGRLHRIDGRLHRIDGPAFEYTNGVKEYWVDGIELTEDQFLTRTTLKELTVADIEKLVGYSVKVVK